MSPESQPPQYSRALRPALLSLDGGGTRVISQIFLLCEIMHRLHWDLSPPKSQTPLYNPLPSPADCFDYIGTGGTGSIVALLLACGYPPEQARDRFMELAQSITDSNYDLHSLLEKVVPGPMPMWHDGKLINDFRSKCNVWIYAPKIEGNSTGMSQGTLIREEEPVIRNLIPLVTAEVRRELAGQTNTLNYTLPFLQAICPIFDDCSVLLSLGSGEVPCSRPITPPPSSHCCPPISLIPTSIAWLISPSSISGSMRAPSPSPVPSSRQTLQDIRNLEKYVPTYTYGRTYIRLQPNMTIWSLSGEQGSPADWESERFGDHKMLISGYCGRVENARMIDSIVEILRRREFGVSGLRKPSDGNMMQELVFKSARHY